jgi:hypothetical protein
MHVKITLIHLFVALICLLYFLLLYQNIVQILFNHKKRKKPKAVNFKKTALQYKLTDLYFQFLLTFSLTFPT